MQSAGDPVKSSFAKDVLEGLSSNPKYLSSKYFYDDEGSRLFQEIMKLPEYYLTRSEMEIFVEQTLSICTQLLGQAKEFDLIELGAGDGTKTAVLIDYFLKKGVSFKFVPIDISAKALKLLIEKLTLRFPMLSIQTERGDYFDTLKAFRTASKIKKVILFLGSNIGNFSEAQALGFFRDLRKVMDQRDVILIGFDLHKNPRTILNAYDDSLGVTPRFNLNLLKRINSELGGNFRTDEFLHYASYHPLDRAARSFLISQQDQTVYIESLAKTFVFSKWEPIYMEVSQKYDLEMIEQIAIQSGFRVIENFFDSNKFYTNSLWAPV